MARPADPQPPRLRLIVTTRVALVTAAVLTPERSNARTGRLKPGFCSARMVLAPSLVLCWLVRTKLSFTAPTEQFWSWQLDEQQEPALPFAAPSSHCSPASVAPSPQIALVQPLVSKPHWLSQARVPLVKP